MILTDAQIEKRLRHRLSLCGLRMHKVNGVDGPRYTLYSADDPEQGDPMTLNALIDHADRLTERRKERRAARGR